MPRFLEPGGTFDFVLPEDRGKEKPFTFQLRVVRKRDARKVRELRRRFIECDAKDIAERDAIVTELIEYCVLGWSNTDEPFTVDRLQDLTEMEAWELINASELGAALSADDQKKSE